MHELNKELKNLLEKISSMTGLKMIKIYNEWKENPVHPFAVHVDNILGELYVFRRKDALDLCRRVEYFYNEINEIKKENNNKIEKIEDSALNVQIGGGHYKNFKIQPIEFIHANKIPFCEANVIKYICRWKEKNGLEDLKKVKHYVDLLIDLEGLKNEVR